MCHSRSSLPTMTVLQAPTTVPSTSPGPRRSSGPEIFTFDPIPEPAVASIARPSAYRGHRKRSRRVLYPRAVSVLSGQSGIRGNGGTSGPRADLFPLSSSGPAAAASRRSEPCQKTSLSSAHHRLLPDPDG
uniref:Immediate early response 3 n=1 Tax=Rousettus aegyptiacus TaxID=9407 RepID=A0A7J8K9L0_ROUAE|nr:immediate early response 3 [Rousettus aegyptiacus]